MIYDTIIIGGGTAGLTAALYASRYNLKTLLIGSEIGGLMNYADPVENFPGFISIKGMELMQLMRKQVERLKVKVLEEEVVSLSKKNKSFGVAVKKGRAYEAKTLILTMGSRRRKLNIPGEDKYIGRGVSYCGTCDAPLFKNKTVGVAGGSDAAVQTALLLARYAKKVYIIYRKEKIRAEPINTRKVMQNKKISVINNTNVIEVRGNSFVQKVIFDRPYNGNKEFKLDGIFIEVGEIPAADLAKQIGIKLTEKNEIEINRFGETNIQGVFAGGDVTNSYIRQAVTAAAEGAVAAFSAYKYLQNG